MTRRKKTRGESIASGIIILGLVILVCFTLAIGLGREYICIMIGCKGGSGGITGGYDPKSGASGVGGMEGSMKDSDGDFVLDGQDADPNDPDVQ